MSSREIHEMDTQPIPLFQVIQCSNPLCGRKFRYKNVEQFKITEYKEALAEAKIEGWFIGLKNYCPHSTPPEKSSTQ